MKEVTTQEGISLKRYYCAENKAVYDESFNEIGRYIYTKDVEGLTRITKSSFIADMNFCGEKDDSGWYIIKTEVPVDVMATAAEKVYAETEGKR